MGSKCEECNFHLRWWEEFLSLWKFQGDFIPLIFLKIVQRKDLSWWKNQHTYLDYVQFSMHMFFLPCAFPLRLHTGCQTLLIKVLEMFLAVFWKKESHLIFVSVYIPLKIIIQLNKCKSIKDNGSYHFHTQRARCLTAHCFVLICAPMIMLVLKQGVVSHRKLRNRLTKIWSEANCAVFFPCLKCSTLQRISRHI